MVNGVNYSGSEIEMNPTVPSGTTPTEATGCRVDDDYYSFPSGGGGGGGSSSIDLLWDSGARNAGATLNQTYNFAHPISDYDELVTVTRQLGDVGGTYDHTCYNNILVADIMSESNKTVLITNYGQRHVYITVNENTFVVWNSNECALCKVYGIKY